MLRNAGLLMVFLLLRGGLSAQAPAPLIQWHKCYGGPYQEVANSVTPTADGGYIFVATTIGGGGDITGFHTPLGTGDYWVVKLDAAGAIQWQRCLGGSYIDNAIVIREVPGGGYIVGGSAASGNGDQTGLHSPTLADFWVVRLDATGAILWQKSLGGTRSDLLADIQVTSDGGFILAGSTDSNDGDVTGNHGTTDCWVVKLKPDGTIEWQRCLGGSMTDQSSGICVSTDGNFILAGAINSVDGDVVGYHGGLSDVWVVKIDKTNGAIIWQKCLGGASSDFASAVVSNPDDGGVVVAAYTSSAAGGDIPGNHQPSFADYWIFRLDAMGNFIWNRNYGGPGEDDALAIDRTSDGDYIIAGNTAATGGDVSCMTGVINEWVIRVSGANGNLQWQKTLGGQKFQQACSVRCTPDGGCIVAGITNSAELPGYHPDASVNIGDAYLVKLTVAVTPTVTISTPPLNVCAGTPITLTATASPSGLYTYFWNRNGSQSYVSTVPTYTASDFTNGEQVTCIILPIDQCMISGGPSIISNTVTMSISTQPAPTVTITTPLVDICQGNTVVFSAGVTNGGTVPHYQWLINGVSAGAPDNYTFTTAALKNADVVSCLYTATTACALPGPVPSNNLTLQVSPLVTPSLRLDVTPSSGVVCSGQPVSFAADPTNGGVSPNYEWKLNGAAVGNNGPTYTVGNPANGDVITCLMTSHAYCATPAEVSAPPVTLTVSAGGMATVVVGYTPYPACEGATLTFKATATDAGPNPVYQWAVNGTPVGTNSPTYKSSSLSNLDNVTCQVSGGTGSACVTPGSGVATVLYYPIPHVNTDKKVMISRGQSVVLDLGATGDISTYAWSPATGLSDPAIAGPTAQPLVTTEYTLLLTSSAGCTATGTITVSVVSTLLLPSAFTPNGDGHNDVLYIMGAPAGAVIKEFAIFNRWGQRIFSVHNAPPGDRAFGWNGTVNGQLAQAGAYAYEIVLGKADGSREVYKGTVMLVR